MDGDIRQVTLLVLGFLVALGLLIFTMDWLEESIDAPPSRLRQRLLGLVRRWGSHRAPDDLQAWLSLPEEEATAEPARLPLQRQSPENGVLPPLVDTLRDEPGSAAEAIPKTSRQ